MRAVSSTFLAALKSGFLSEITKEAIEDPDLNLEIREGYINLYYKGNSLLKLRESPPGQYGVDVHEKFLTGLSVPSGLIDQTTTAQFVSNIPRIKRNIIRFGRHSIETEYEQLIIRANNFEQRNNSEYFLLDRQYAIGRERFDLMGFCWAQNGRARNQEVPMCLMEVKFALNGDIANVHEQLARYYSAVKPRANVLADEAKSVFQQKLELGLYDRSPRRDALSTLTFSPNIADFQFILVLVDYNPNSTLIDYRKLAQLPFANQIRVFSGGLAMWHQNVRRLAHTTSR
jgi:hypothetical protein